MGSGAKPTALALEGGVSKRSRHLHAAANSTSPIHKAARLLDAYSLLSWNTEMARPIRLRFTLFHWVSVPIESPGAALVQLGELGTMWCARPGRNSGQNRTHQRGPLKRLGFQHATFLSSSYECAYMLGATKAESFVSWFGKGNRIPSPEAPIGFSSPKAPPFSWSRGGRTPRSTSVLCPAAGRVAFPTIALVPRRYLMPCALKRPRRSSAWRPPWPAARNFHRHLACAAYSRCRSQHRLQCHHRHLLRSRAPGQPLHRRCLLRWRHLSGTRRTRQSLPPGSDLMPILSCAEPPQSPGRICDGTPPE